MQRPKGRSNLDVFLEQPEEPEGLVAVVRRGPAWPFWLLSSERWVAIGRPGRTLGDHICIL